MPIRPFARWTRWISRRALACAAWRILACVELLSVAAWADEAFSLRPLDLVSQDVALVCEVDRPKLTWTKFRQSELFRRASRTPLYQQWIESKVHQHWQEVEEKATERTGMSLSDQLLDLCAQELVLAMYLSEDGRPEGVLLTRADDADAPARLLQTWQRLEPTSSLETLTHQGREYFRRKKPGPQGSALFYAVLKDILIVSDHEPRIRQALERLPADREKPANDAGRFAGKPWPPDGAPIRISLPARAWDRVWQNVPSDDQGARLLSRWWPAIDAITATIRLDDGFTADFQLQLNESKTDENWRAWCTVTAHPQEFLSSVPRDAFLVAAGSLTLKPVFQLAQELAADKDRAEWQKTRRIARSLLGGHDPLDEVLPALGEQVGLYLVRRAAPAGDLPFDGVLTSRFSPAATASGLHLALDPALSAGLVLLSADCAEKFAGDDPPIVRSELSEGKSLRWLETAKPIRLAYQLTSQGLTVARSVELLRQHLAVGKERPDPSPLQKLAETRFPEAEQFLCIDVRRFREASENGDADSGAPPRFPSWKPWLELCDSAYLATRFDPAAVTIQVGWLVDPQ